MNWVDKLILEIKRAETPPARLAHDVYRWLERFQVPDVGAMRAVYQALYYAHDAWEGGVQLFGGKLLYEPMVRSRVHKLGKRVRFHVLPYINGQCKITIGDDCTFNYFSVGSGKFIDEPELIIGNHCYFSNDVTFSVNRRVTVGNYCGFAPRCVISDSDNHPTSIESRERGEALSLEDIAPVTLEDYVWLGRGAQVMKGVTIGRGAVVAAGSVVVADVPAGALAMGVPARFVKR